MVLGCKMMNKLKSYMYVQTIIGGYHAIIIVYLQPLIKGGVY